MAVDPEESGRRGSRWRLAAWGTAAALILLPPVAIQVTAEVAWNLADLIFAIVLVAGVGIAFELAVRTTASRAYRAAVGIALAATFLLSWINLAVGIIGNEENSANLMYFGVLIVGVVGALLARFEPDGMARAMIATAIAQALVAVIALIAGLGFTGPITVFFAGLWLISASLFQKARREGVTRSRG